MLLVLLGAALLLLVLLLRGLTLLRLVPGLLLLRFARRPLLLLIVVFCRLALLLVVPLGLAALRLVPRVLSFPLALLRRLPLRRLTLLGGVLRMLALRFVLDRRPVFALCRIGFAHDRLVRFIAIVPGVQFDLFVE